MLIRMIGRSKGRMSEGCVRCVVCAVLRARERPTERARAVARAGEYKCDYLAVREVRGVF